MSLLHFHLGRKAITIQMTPKDFKRRARKALDEMLWGIMQSEEQLYRARQAEVRAEEAESRAHTAYEAGVEAIRILSAEVKEVAEGRPVSTIVYDEFLRQAAEKSHDSPPN